MFKAGLMPCETAHYATTRLLFHSPACRLFPRMAGKLTPGNNALALGIEGHVSGQDDEPFGECRRGRHLCLLRCLDVPLGNSHEVSFCVERSPNAAVQQVGNGSWSEHRKIFLSSQVHPVLHGTCCVRDSLLSS